MPPANAGFIPMNTPREDLLQTLVQRMMSIMRHVRHPGPPPGEPPLSPPQVTLLFAITHNPKGASVKELAEFSGVTPGAITQFVDALVEKGLVMREGDPVDRRVVRLKVTPLAISQFEKFRQEHLASFSTVFEVLTDNELQQLLTLIDKIDISHTAKDKPHVEPDKTP
jgi:DNA-binding MarR family transcriptional regulator